MHGLIFKIKESHRQDQSESFVIYICAHILRIVYAAFSLFTTSQMKSLHYDQCSIYIYMVYICVVSSRRNKTNPYHRNKFIPVLIIQLFYKHSSPNYQHMINYWKLINKLFNMHKLKHSQPHSLLCHLWCILFHSFWCDIYIYDYMKSWRSSFDKLFFSSYILYSHC